MRYCIARSDKVDSLVDYVDKVEFFWRNYPI